MCMSAELEPIVVIQGPLYTMILFGCFTAVALFSKRRSYLFLGSAITSLVLTILFAKIVSFSMGYSLMSMPYLLLSLLVGCLYLVYDTQLIIERFDAGDDDAVSHSLTILFPWTS
uniref:Uncharacterized protein n=1 Tax=Strombidium inclinatum TaxID=197538 RepID=A0A7S3ILK3_9SPIT|mmetsp:Transcript_24802/g.38602  ORF Transcript_24802/g.38602 Transcript_24802/m.38602 type:complete len:115 (+) Transcript_24802:297-641(+)